MKIRKATKDRKDYEAFKELYYRTEYSYEVGTVSKERTEINPLDPPLEYKEYCTMLERTFREYLLLEDNGNILGSATIVDSEIQEMVINRKHQLQGNGKIFYQLIESKIKKSGEDEIIMLRCRYPGAAEFWHKQGFRSIGTMFIKKI